MNEFFTYVVSFWAVWKCLDVTVHLVKHKYRPKKEHQCSNCLDVENRLKEHSEIEFERSRIESDKRKAENELNDLKFLIAMNKATETELDEVPGIGPVTAKKIIKNRPYHSIKDCDRVLGQLTFSVRNWSIKKNFTSR